MHGRPRKPLKEEDESVLSVKAEKLLSLQSQFLANHQNRIYTKEALDLSAKLLEINPECYTAWNYRKLAVQHNLSQSDSDSVTSLFDQELKLVENALKKNFKSYGAWHHRKWVLSKGHSSTDNELRLLDDFQKADARNFHAWNYRRFVTALMKISDEDELKYTEKVIGVNFSNYSAWHNRSVLLSTLSKRKAEGFSHKEKVLQEEYEYVENAIFTDSDDQSGWFYHLWLIDQTVKNDSPLLVSSWPSHGANITLNGNNYLHGSGLSLLNSTLSDTKTLPVILYFNQAVEGVNSSTVAVKSELLKEDLVWKPLSTNNSSTAQVWVVYLNIGNMELKLSKTYSIEITVGHSTGILSSNGYHYGDPSQITFEVCVQTAHTEPVDGQRGKLTSWKDNDFRKIDHFEESNSAVSTNHHIPTTSNWCMEAIDQEITNFQDSLSDWYGGSDKCIALWFEMPPRNDEHGGWEVRGSRWFIFPQRESSFSQDGWSWYVQALFLNLGDFSMSWGINQDSYDFGEHVQWYVSSCLRFTMLLKVRFFITKSTTQAESAKNWYSKVILDLRQSCIISRGRVQGGSGGWQDRRHIYSTIDDKLIANKSRIIVVVIGVLDMEILISIGLRRSSNLCHTHHLRAYISLSRITQINICEVKWHQTSNLRLSMEIRIYIATSFSVLMTDVMNFNGGNHLQIRSYFLIKIVLFLNQQINAAKKALEVHQSSGAIKRQPLYEIYHSQNIQLFRNTIKVVKYTYYRLLITMAAPNNPAQNDDCANPHQTETNADSLDYCMVGRLLINRPVHFPSFRDRMADLWKPERKVNITKIDPNRFMFQFFSLGDMQRIYHSGPWLFDSFPLVMRRLAFGEDPKSVPLDTIEMWVQAHNLPFGFMSESMGILLGNHVGKLEKYDTENNFGNWRRFMRLRVAMNTDEPLKHSWQFERPDAEAVTVNFRYEKLGNFCYVCGVLGHTHNYCQKRYEEGFVAGERQWGPYLKAEFRGPNGDNVNPWLHDGRNLNNGGMQRQGGIARGAECNNIHRLVGRVKIGRNQGTRSLIFMRYTGAQSSTEWVQFSVANMPTTSVGVRPMQAHPTVTPIMQLASTGEEEGDDARIARLIMEARLKNPLTIEAQATGTRTADQITEMQQPISQLAASLSQVMQMGMTAATGPQLNARGTVDINIRDGPKQLKRLRLEEKEEGDEDGTATDGRTAIAAPIESDSEEHRESMICDPVLLANNNVMAGPGHQARQEK